LWGFVSVDEYEEKEYLVTVQEINLYEVRVTATDVEDAKYVAEETYLEEGILWSVDAEAADVREW